MRHFDYSRAESVDQAVATYSQAEAAAFLAGGTNLLDMVKIDIMRPELMVDVNRLGLDEIEKLDDGRLRIGTLVTNSVLAHHFEVTSQPGYAVLSEALLSGASTQLRNKATTGGNMMQRVRCPYFRDGVSACNKRDPGSGCAAIDGYNRSVHAVLGTSDKCIATYPSDMSVAMAAVGATVSVTGPEGSREIDFLDFHLLPGDKPWEEFALKDDELITHVALDAPIQGARSAYLKLRDRSSYQFALASSAVIVALDGNTIRDARLAMGGVATKPWRAKEAENALKGQPATEQTFARAAQIAMQDAKGYKHNAFKIPLGRQAIVRNLTTLTA
ncbi:xanthine dehydrogenase family protein subunit M [Halomonas sp. Bachu 37]|uniref:FAD binding domain-containing protein n=1 Tax=Halomonas kashgarensis TaxID=3084920 RepID=UPI003217835F